MKNGFTLTELFTIIAVIGILFLIGFPTFRAYQPTLQLNGAIRELITDLRYAQQLTVTEQIDHGVYLSTSTDSYQIIKYDETEEILEEKSLPDKVSFLNVSGFTGDIVRFNPYGAVDEAGEITLINTKGATTTIEVRPSGFVKITK